MQAPNSGPVLFLTPAQKSAGLVLDSSANASLSTPGLQVTGLGSTEPEPEAPNRPQQRKWILLVSTCLGITAVIAIAIALGLHFGTRRNNNNLSNSNSNSNSNPDNNNQPPSTGGPVQQGSNGPSDFTKDPKLKNSFYGVVYNMRDTIYPADSPEPTCNQTPADTIVDVQLLSQITTRIRLTSSDCNQPALVLEAIKQTKTNLKVFPAIFVVDKDEVGYLRQKTALQQALQTYGSDNILGITVGVRFMSDYISQHNGTSANSMIGLAASATLKEKIADIRQMLTSMNINILVGTADSVFAFNNDLLGAVDFGMSYLQPWSARVAVQDAATWTLTTFKAVSVDVANVLANKPQMYIGATGWPTFSQTPSAQTNASEPNLQIYLNNFVCTANAQGVRYFWVDFNDSPWLAQRYGYGGEGSWGLFDSNKKLKAITLPNCSHD